jgi:hypothetical protein
LNTISSSLATATLATPLLKLFADNALPQQFA